MAEACLNVVRCPCSYFSDSAHYGTL